MVWKTPFFCWNENCVFLFAVNLSLLCEIKELCERERKRSKSWILFSRAADPCPCITLPCTSTLSYICVVERSKRSQKLPVVTGAVVILLLRPVIWRPFVIFIILARGIITQVGQYSIFTSCPPPSIPGLGLYDHCVSQYSGVSPPTIIVATLFCRYHCDNYC